MIMLAHIQFELICQHFKNYVDIDFFCMLTNSNATTDSNVNKIVVPIGNAMAAAAITITNIQNTG